MTKMTRRIMSLLLCAAMLIGYIPALQARAAQEAVATVTDTGTAASWEHMMGTSTDGNRYAGRVWADKSVYKEGDTVVLNTSSQAGSSFKVENLEDDEAFQVVFSALGSSMTTTTTTSKTGPLDVVLILDNSVSMNTVSGGTTRMKKVIQAANNMLSDLLSDDKDVRLGIVAYAQNASTVLPFGDYNNGVELRVNNDTGTGSRNGIITAYTSAGQRIDRNYQSAGYANYTNTQAGFTLGMEMLASANNTENRKPVVLLLTDGAANTALDTLFDEGRNGTVRQVYHTSNIDPMIALSTLLSNAYNKTVVQKHYGKTPMIYGIGVDLSATDGSNAIINPKDNFNARNTNRNIVSAYEAYTNTWSKGNDVSTRSGGYSFAFRHDYPAGITDADVMANINYVDTYYPVFGADVSGVFDQIYQELTSGVFNPISTSNTTEGGTGAENTPLIYVDHIGRYMEVKEIQSVTLFGASYGVTKGATTAGVDKDVNDNDVPVTITSYTVARGTGRNPTTNEDWNTTEDIKIQVIEYQDKSQKLEVEINQEILPILLEKVDDRNINDQHTATITEIMQQPLRVYYTIGLDADILLPNGTVDVTKIDSSYIGNVDGNQLSFYSNQYGVRNPLASGNGNGDAHIGFKPSKANRYYYHQTNQDVFTAVSRKNGQPMGWDASEYGVPYKEDTFNFTWLTYDAYRQLEAGANDDKEVYTYVTYYHPTPSTTDAANAAEEITYLVYTKWGYLKESIAFYDHNAETYINYHETNGYTTGEVGYAIPTDKVAATIAAYKAANPNGDIYGKLGVESLRTSRLHNMLVTKTNAENATNTAANRYSPEYTYETAEKHHGNDVVIWLGNNGKLTVEIDTGIALTKAVTEPIGSVNDTYDLTVTIPAGVAANPVVKDAYGNAVASTYRSNVLTVSVKADQTVYITGIPAGTTCEISEDTTGKDYYISSKTDTVTVPTLTEVLNGAAQFAPATVTNTPNKYGDLTIVKDIAHNLSIEPNDMKNKEFTFQVKLNPVPVKKTYQLDVSSASLHSETQITVQDDGTFTVRLKDNESITVMDLPANTGYEVTETNLPDGYTNTSGVVSGTIDPDGDHDAHFINTYGYTPIKPEITVTGTKTLNDPHDTYTDDEEFIFVLSQFNGTGYDQLATATAKAGQPYTFRLANVLSTELGIGEYYFRVTEQAGTTDGMTYDATRGLFKVTVTDEGADGVLEFAVADAGNTTVSGNTVNKDFTNTYDVDRTFVDIDITKELTNTTGVNLPLNLFHFQLVNTEKPAGNSDIPEKTVTTDASGKATIRISDLGPGEYKFTLTEQDGDMPGMIYDTDPREIVITVVENSGILVATTKIDSVETNDVTFENEYKLNSVKHTIRGTKLLNGRNLGDDEFEFALYETDSSFNLAPNATPDETVKNAGISFSFDEITYTQVGTYYYSVKELAGTKPGVTYDTTHYHITVEVTVDGENLKKDVVIHKIGHNAGASDEIVFVNTYTAKPTEFAILGTKALTGRSQQAGEFTFYLYNEAGEKIDEATNKADGTFAFNPITYDAEGDYHYTVKEAAGNAPGVTYDDSEIRVTVTVTDHDAELSAAADKTAEEVKFENTYTPAAATARFGGTKTLTGGTVAEDMFTFHLYETDSTFDIAGKTPKTATSKADGTFRFGKITYDETGTYFYVITEDATQPLEEIVYDRTQHKLMVQVADNGDGKLRATVTDLDTGAATSPAENAEASVSFTNATFDEAAEKEVFLGQQSTMIDGQKVNAGDILTYHITYTNYTGEPVVADIMDTIPNHTTYVEGSADQGGTYVGTHVNWILNVAAGESVTVSFQVSVDETEAIVSNTAVIRDGVNTYYTNEVKNHTIDDILVKDVFSAEDTTISIDGKKVEAGEELLYTISFTNASRDVADISITDIIPANTTYVEGSADNGGVYDNGVITWTIEDVPAWETVTVTFKVKVNEDIGNATISNQATATDGNNQFVSNVVSNFTEVEETEPPENPTAPTDPEDPTEPTGPEEPTEPTEPEEPTEPTEPDDEPIEEPDDEPTAEPDDEPTTEPDDAPTEDPADGPSGPQTGDPSQLYLWIMLLIISAGGILTACIYIGKKTEEQA